MLKRNWRKIIAKVVGEVMEIKVRSVLLTSPFFHFWAKIPALLPIFLIFGAIIPL
jgi:hypothetical protein